MSIDDTDVTDTEVDERYFDMMAAGAAVMHVVAFALVGEFALENLAYGAVAGLFSGLGTYLFLPWFLRLQTRTEAGEVDVSFSELAEQVDRSTQLGVLGLGLELGSIVMLVVALALDGADFVLGGGAAVVVALLVYLVGSVLLDR